MAEHSDPKAEGDPRFLPISGMTLPRFAGAPSFMRLPVVGFDDPLFAEVEIGLVGVPWDGGTTNRPGARHGPRQLRDLSTMIRRMHPVTRFDPFVAARCADLGDVAPNPVDLQDTLARVTAFFDRLFKAGVTPLSAGGDHLMSLPILRALAKDQPLGLVQFDSHTDLWDRYFGDQLYTHGTPFRRAIEEGLIDPKRTIQIGIRGTMYDLEDHDFAEAVGVRVVPIEELFARGVEDVMAEARGVLGDQPAYASFDIDFLDPAFAPGTGTPEIGGPTAYQAQACVRGLEGVRLVGADLVEVSPPFDPTGGTAWVGASMMFELLCVLAAARRRA